MGEYTIELKSHFLRLYQMALTDGDFNRVEIDFLYDLALKKGITKDELSEILKPCNFKLSVPSDLKQKIEYLLDLARMIIADNVVEDDEKSTFKKYILKFGFLEENANDLINYFIDAAQNNKSLSAVIDEINS